MSTSRQEQAALDFALHAFEQVAEQLAADVRWDQVGGSRVAGRDEVLRVCRQTREELAGVEVEVTRLRTVAGPDAVVVESVTVYREPDGSQSQVASCDLVDFADGLVQQITSFTVEV